MQYAVIEKASGLEVYRYEADAPVEWNEWGFATHNHVPVPPAAVPSEIPTVDPARWKIFVGAFFDRFGIIKLFLLSDPDPMTQAMVKDATVRKYIDLLGRHDELAQMIAYLKSRGYAIDEFAVLNAEPTDTEVWHG